MNRYTNEYAYMRIIPLESLLSLYAEPRCNARTLILGICSPLGKFLYTRIFSVALGHPVQLVYCMQNESPGMSFMRDLLS